MLKSALSTGVSLPDTASIEESLLSIPGVRGARIIRSVLNDLDEIHVVASPRRSPKKIVRDIESFLMVQYAYRIDYRRISLVQVNDTVSADRVTLGRVEQIQQPDGTFIEVEILNGEQRFVAKEACSDDLALAAAKGTVAALNDLFSNGVPLRLSGTLLTSIGNRQVVTAYVTFQETAIEHLLGTTFVRNSVPEAAARAVLAATNRRMATWLSERRVNANMLAVGI
jgi:hypothetical protein